jgi:hypothetical protein
LDTPRFAEGALVDHFAIGRDRGDHTWNLAGVDGAT